MKVVFTQDVPGVASSAEIKQVADGYARNYLLPKGFAVLATSEEIKRVEAQQRAKERRVEQEIKEAQALAESIQGMSLVFSKRVRSDDSIYGSVSSVAISQRLRQMGYEVNKNKVKLEKPLRKLGTEKVVIELAREAVATITVTIEPQEREQGTEVG